MKGVVPWPCYQCILPITALQRRHTTIPKFLKIANDVAAIISVLSCAGERNWLLYDAAHYQIHLPTGQVLLSVKRMLHIG